MVFKSTGRPTYVCAYVSKCVTRFAGVVISGPFLATCPRPPRPAGGPRGSHSSILVAVSTPMRLPVMRAALSATRRQCADLRPAWVGQDHVPLALASLPIGLDNSKCCQDFDDLWNCQTQRVVNRLEPRDGRAYQRFAVDLSSLYCYLSWWKLNCEA